MRASSSDFRPEAAPGPLHTDSSGVLSEMEGAALLVQLSPNKRLYRKALLCYLHMSESLAGFRECDPLTYFFS